MPTIHAQVSPEALLHAVEQLGTTELDRFVSDVLTLLARRRAPALPPEEARLLTRINKGLPAELRDRLDVLGDKRQSESLTPEEHAELIRLTEEAEALDVQRVEDLTELARLRGVPLGRLMDELGLRPSAHG